MKLGKTLTLASGMLIPKRDISVIIIYLFDMDITSALDKPETLFF